jgi:hypothetical protein
MLNHVEMDRSFKLEQQYCDASTDPVILVNLFDVAPRDHEHFIRAWAEDAASSRPCPAIYPPSSTRASVPARCS